MTTKFSQTPEQKATASHPHRIQEESVKSCFLNKRLLEFTLRKRLRRLNNSKHLHSMLFFIIGQALQKGSCYLEDEHFRGFSNATLCYKDMNYKTVGISLFKLEDE